MGAELLKFRKMLQIIRAYQSCPVEREEARIAIITELKVVQLSALPE